MPSRVNNAPSSRFELPALNLNFGSITDGTDIPPPPDSPVQKEPTPSQAPRLGRKVDTKEKPIIKDGATTASKQTTSNEGQQSNGNGSAAPSLNRPISRGGNSVMDERKIKRSSGWFKRLTGDSPTKRSSLMFEEGSAPPHARPSGPPPPMIPELKEFEKGDSGFGSDLFKNIK